MTTERTISDDGVRCEVGNVSGIGTEYRIWAVGAHPATLYEVTVASGPVHKRVGAEGLTWTEACDLVREEVAQELLTEGADPDTVRPEPCCEYCHTFGHVLTDCPQRPVDR